MKLWRVEIDGVAYVLAENGRQAEREVERLLPHQVPIACHATLNCGRVVDEDWADSLPFGKDDEERTVAEIIAAYVPELEP